jgi:DNA-directed RNA polymerase subunit RPC12/RpoP
MGYQFVTSCAICAKRFGVLWVMNPIHVGTKNVATITCPLCGSRFSQDAKELVPVGSEIHNLVVGRPVRSVEIDYDCPRCGSRSILVSLLHTDLSWDELSRDHFQSGVCDNRFCSKRGLPQKLKPSRVVLGSLNPA